MSLTTQNEISREPGAWSKGSANTIAWRLLRHFGCDPYHSSAASLRELFPNVDFADAPNPLLLAVRDHFRVDGRMIDFSEHDLLLWMAERIDFNAVLRDAEPGTPGSHMWGMACGIASDDGRDVAIDPAHAYLPATRNFELCCALVADSDTTLILSYFVEPLPTTKHPFYRGRP